jgi:hypothetical protein
MNMFKSTAARTPSQYIRTLEEPRRSEIQELHALITKTVPALKPYIIAGMIGYGEYHYKYPSGREGDWCVVGLASRKDYISLYISASDGNQYLAEQFKGALPKASIGRSCIRFKRASDLDLKVVKRILQAAERLTTQSAKAGRAQDHPKAIVVTADSHRGSVTGTTARRMSGKRKQS